MIFQRLRLHNFRSFREPTEYTFESLDGGLYQVTGFNSVEPDLGGNGVGKSTLFSDALNFVLYGVSARGAKGKILQSWGAQTPGSVTLWLEKDGVSYEVKREIGNSSVDIKEGGKLGRRVNQEDVDKLLGMSRGAFRHSICIGQFNELFFDLRPAEKMNLFSEVFGFYTWESLSEVAKTLYKETSTQVLKAERRSERLLGEQGRLELVTDDLKAEAVKFDKERVRLSKMYTTAIDNLKNKLKEIDKERAKADRLHANLERKVEVLREEKEKAAADVQEFKYGIVKVEAARAECNKQYKRLQAERNKKFAAVCFECGQEISEQHKKEWKAAVSKKMEKKKEELAAFDVQIGAQKETLAGLRTVQEEAMKEFASVYTELEEVEAYKTNLVIERGNIRQEVSSKKKLLREHEGKEFQFGKLLSKNEKTLKEIGEKLVVLEEGVVELKQQQQLFSFWAKGFKEIRSFILERTLSLLQLEINNNINKFGLKGWEIKLEVEREGTQGKTIKQFSVFVKSAESKEWAPWSSWSGGETQRLRLAGTLAFADLILKTSGITSNIQVIDEKLDGLSGAGVDNVLNVLNIQGAESDRQIYIISHLDTAYGSYADTVHIEKDKRGSFIT